jgi:ankyrin repeat protein
MSFSKEKRESFSKFLKEVSSNRFKDINKRNEEGETILHQAVEISDYKTVRLLIKKGQRLMQEIKMVIRHYTVQYSQKV